MSVWETSPHEVFPVFDDVRTYPPEDEAGAMQLKEQARKVHEEAGELMVAACDYVKANGTKVEKDTRSRMLDELADLMQAMTNFAYAFCVTEEELGHAAWGCWDRNAERGRY